MTIYPFRTPHDHHMTLSMKSEERGYEEYIRISWHIKSHPNVQWMTVPFQPPRHFGEAFRLHLPACAHVLRSLPGRHCAGDGVRTDLLPTERPLRPQGTTPAGGDSKGTRARSAEESPAPGDTAKFWKVELYGRSRERRDL